MEPGALAQGRYIRFAIRPTPDRPPRQLEIATDSRDGAETVLGDGIAHLVPGIRASSFAIRRR